MNLKEAAELVDLPRSIVERLHKDGMIDDPVSDHDLKGLAIIAFVRGRIWYLRRFLAPLPKRYKQKIIEEGGLSRAERYALSCYLNAEAGERVSIEDVVQRVHHHLKVRLTKKQIVKIRATAYDIRRKRRSDPTKNS